MWLFCLGFAWIIAFQDAVKMRIAHTAASKSAQIGLIEDTWGRAARAVVGHVYMVAGVAVGSK